jgi:hypothetical protein
MNTQKLISEARRLHEDLLWSEKAFFQTATLWRTAHWLLGVPGVIAATTAGLAAVKATNPGLTAVAAVVSAILSALLTFLNPHKSAREFHSAGVRASSLRARIRRYFEIDLSGSDPPEDARQRLERLAELKAHLMETTPHIGGVPYWLARRSIERDQHTHEVDKPAGGP